MCRALIVVAKEPVAGFTKTRLVPPLTSLEAAELYRAFLLDFGWVSLGPHEVLGLGVGIPPYLDVVLVNESEWDDGQLPRHLVAVMNDGAGNLSCINCAAVSNGHPIAIVLWDHETGPTEGPIPLAKTFSELMGEVLLSE